MQLLYCIVLYCIVLYNTIRSMQLVSYLHHVVSWSVSQLVSQGLAGIIETTTDKQVINNIEVINKLVGRGLTMHIVISLFLLIVTSSMPSMPSMPKHIHMYVCSYLMYRTLPIIPTHSYAYNYLEYVTRYICMQVSLGQPKYLEHSSKTRGET